jgi:hypothetical protein
VNTWHPTHDPQTWAEGSPDGLRWISTCPCGWRSADYPDEFAADYAGLAHDDGSGSERVDRTDPDT